MSVEIDRDQKPDDTVIAVTLEEHRLANMGLVREVAQRWTDGMRVLFVFSGASGFIAAPLSAEWLAQSTRLVVGFLLSAVLLTALVALMLLLSAANGSTRAVKAPSTLVELVLLRQATAKAARRNLIIGRALSVSSVILFVVAVASIWFTESEQTVQMLSVETLSDVTICGESVDAPPQRVAVVTEADRRVEIPLSDVALISVAEACP